MTTSFRYQRTDATITGMFTVKFNDYYYSRNVSTVPNVVT